MAEGSKSPGPKWSEEQAADLSLFRKKLGLTLGPLIALALLLALFVLASEIFLLAFLGVLGAIFLNGIADRIGRRTGLPHSWSLALTLISVTAVISLLFLVLTPTVSSQVTELSQRLPQVAADLQNRVSQTEMGREFVEHLSAVQGSLSGSRLFSRLFGVTSAVLGFLGGMAIFVFLSVYFAANPKLYKRGLIRLFPVARRGAVAQLLADLRQAFGWWIVGRLSSMFLVGVLVSVGLLLLEVPLAGALGLIAAILDFVPNFGPIAAAVPAVALSLAEEGNTFLYVMGLYAVVQLLEAYIFLPLILKRAVDLPPVLTILVQLFMGIIAGPFGLVLGDPIAVLLLVSVRSLYVERILEAPADSAAPEQRLAS